MRERNDTVGIEGLVDAGVFLDEVVAPVLLEVIISLEGPQLEYGLGTPSPQRALLKTMRSFTRWRHAPSMIPVATCHPAAKAFG